MDQEVQKDPEEIYQEKLKEEQELLGYCKKIQQGIENLDENSGERAIWELTQNARDVAENDECIIRITLRDGKLVFAHRGMPFEFQSLLALVNQNSSKDNPNADLAGQYGTGFMTTHAFCNIVTIDAPYKVMVSKEQFKGYVMLENFTLNRSFVSNANDGMEEAKNEMRREIEAVNKAYKREPLYPSLESLDEEKRWTRFSYDLNGRNYEVSDQLARAIRLMPMVLLINKQIKEVEIIDDYAHIHQKVTKYPDSSVGSLDEIEGWQWASYQITIDDRIKYNETPITIKCLESKDGKDKILLPPYPAMCGKVEDIPSLFLWFPLLGTETFGVNFIFHSKRFYPVEKRNNIMLSVDVPSKIEKGKKNEAILVEMMNALLKYYASDENAVGLDISMCKVNFNQLAEDLVTREFYINLQNLWKGAIQDWKVIPTVDGKKAITCSRVKLLHPDFYNKLTPEQCEIYEPVMAQYVRMVTMAGGESILMPEKDLIAWSKVVDRWQCGRDDEFFVTVADVCKAIKSNGENLHTFLMFLKDSGNENLMDDYALLPNRKGDLCLRKSLYYGAFMTDEVYRLVKGVMGDDEAKMFAPAYLDVCDVNPYTENDLQKAIGNTIQQWRNNALNQKEIGALTDEQLDSLLKFCSASMLPEFKNQRGRMMPILAELYEKSFEVIPAIKFREDEEEEFYKPAINFLLDYTLAQVCKKDVAWVNGKKDWLLRFLTEYNPKENEERKKRLDTYGVLPNQNEALCLKSDLKARRDVPDEMVEIYQAVFGKDLKEDWIDVSFDAIVDLQPVHASDIADDIEKALVADMKQEGEHKFEKVVRRIILKIGESKEWEDWFGQVNDKKASYTFNMQSGRAQRSLFSLMDNCSDDHLEQLAKYGKNIEGLLDKLGNLEKQERDSAARFNHLHTIGKHIEDVLRERIGQDVVSITMPESKEDNNVNVDDEQNGQDIVVKVKQDGAWKAIFYVEVKSKWDFNEAAHMSMRQVRMACLHPEMYALCCVDLRPYKDQDLANLPATTILNATHVKMEIGETLFPMMSGILDADKQPDETVIKISEYRSDIPAKVFEVGEPFDALLSRIEQKAREELKSPLAEW